MASQLGGDLVDVEAIVPIGGDPHTYEPTPKDAQMLLEADLILINGMTFEGWIQEVIDNSGTKAKTILITEGITPIDSDKYKNSVDPHAWMDASNGLIYIENIMKAFIAEDPGNKEVFLKNYNSYAAKLKELDQYIIEQINLIPEKQRVLITSHDAFRYYGKRYGLALSAIMGISTEADAQTSDILRISKVIREQKVPALFLESTINPKMLKQIALDNNISIGGELFADSLGGEDSGVSTYYDMLKYNTDTIVKALSQQIKSSTKILDDDSSSSMYLAYVVIGLIMLVTLFVMIKKINI
jgi:ABC-type Zn uptake system ZnuABC Zn-binding protein ZnuA